MKITFISGSHRVSSQSEKVARFAMERLSLLEPQWESELMKLAGNPLPLWDSTVWEGGDTWKKLWSPLAQKLQSSDGFVIVSPEWGGMVPPGLKNFFLLCTGRELGHKPGYLVTVSSSRNGAYPIAELRMSSYKNNSICYLPEHLIVRNAEKVLNPGEPAGEEDAYLRKRLDFGLSLLMEYTKALAQVRKCGKTFAKEFANGR